MSRSFSVTAVAGLALAATALVPAAADAQKGLPVGDVSTTRGGISAPTAEVRFVALPAERGTVVARLERDGGNVLRSEFFPRRLAVPAVAWDGSASGLSADGRTLVLIQQPTPFHRAETTFAVLDAERLRVRRILTLEGAFSFDAISPNGSLLYLIEYTSARDPSRYLVRAYDLRRERLLRSPVIDPRVRGGTMTGYPRTRATSPDGRWEYTLYDGGIRGHPFVHALDTVRRRAVCIDVHALADVGSLYRIHLAVSGDGGRLAVLHRKSHAPVALVDTKTFEVTEPPELVSQDPIGRDDGPPWVVIALAGVFLVGIAPVSKALRRRRALAGAGAVERLETIPVAGVDPHSGGDCRGEDRLRDLAVENGALDAKDGHAREAVGTAD